MKYNQNHLGLLKNAADSGSQEAKQALAKHFPDTQVLAKSIGDYALDERIIDQEAQEMIDYMWQQTPIMEQFYHFYVANRATKIPTGITDKEFLISTERLGRQLTADEKQGLGAIHSYDIYCEEIEAQWDVKVGDLIHNLGNPDYMETLERMKIAEIGNDIARLTARGVNRTGTSFYNLLYGFPYRLKNMNGKATFSVSSAEVVGMHGFLMTPVKINAGASYADTDILDVMDKLIDNTDSQYHVGAKFLMSKYDASVYADMRSAPMLSGTAEYVGVNVALRETWRTTGQVPMWKGFDIVHCEHMQKVADGGVIIFGDLKNLAVVSHTRVDVTREYKARMSTGGNGYEYTNVFYMNLAVLKPFAMAVAFKSAKAESPVFINGAGAKDDEIESTVSGAPVDIHVYSDTVDADIYYSTNTSHLDTYPEAVADGTKIDPADPEITLTEDTYYFRAFKDGKLLPSDKVTLIVAS